MGWGKSPFWVGTFFLHFFSYVMFLELHCHVLCATLNDVSFERLRCYLSVQVTEINGFLLKGCDLPHPTLLKYTMADP